MSDFKYKNPLDDGYKQFKLTKKQHNNLFKYRQIRWTDKYEYYYNEKEVLLERFYSKLFVVVNSFLFPFTILFYGFENIKKCWRDHKNLYHQKESGNFTNDNISYKSDKYEKIMNIINKNQNA